MRPIRSLLSAAGVLSLLCATAAPVLGQVRPGVFGYQVLGRNGIAGEFCHLFDCTPRALAVVAGETLTLRVNAPSQALFALVASWTATSCVSLPVAQNALVLDQPLVTLRVGVVGGSSPVLACWGGTESTPMVLPAGLPVGLAFATQAVADMPTLVGQGPAFSVAVVTTVR